MAEYIAKSNRETMVIAQVESEQAVRNIHEIVKTPGADVIFIGPADLSNSFGVPGDLKCPKMQEVFKCIVDAVTRSDKALGIMVGNVGMAREWQESGARLHPHDHRGDAWPGLQGIFAQCTTDRRLGSGSSARYRAFMSRCWRAWRLFGSTFGTSKRRAVCVAENLDRMASRSSGLPTESSPKSLLTVSGMSRISMADIFIPNGLARRASSRALDPKPSRSRFRSISSDPKVL